MPTSKNISNLIINKVESQAVYDSMKNRGLINDDELYVVLGEDKIDASSITGMDTYLSDKAYIKKITGSYYGNKSTSSNADDFKSVNAIKTSGRKIQFSFSPVRVIFSDKAAGYNVIAQGPSGAVKTYWESGDGSTSGYYYYAYLEDSTLYVAYDRMGYNASNYDYKYSFNTSGTIYNWTALV